ncbi:hypothetical protein KUTeg_013168 [Tegillarca granosa]|uniref:Cadherin domain-containing protein n=1 Tax=Tegillarca granosa TaxID=220873 RepID=A0ABQ9ETA9_TEGGR|nr:hypothetical protein KUTeg_013168 [Tegillarca granosa]
MLTKPLDFEEQSIYNLNIEVTDNGVPPKKSSGNFTLKVLNSNEEPYNLQVEPTTGSHHFDVDQPTVEENHPINTLIGQLVVLDHDSQDQITFYTVNPEIELYNQKCVPLTNVTSAAELDYEREPVHEINIRVSDHANPPLYFDKVIKIALTDVNEKPGSVTLSRNQVKNLLTTFMPPH